MASSWRAVKHVVRRKRLFDDNELEETNLRRCLSGWDLTALGLGSTLGVGVYVLVGSVALQLAGPAVVLSFLIAAVAALFAGLCYAEFGARVPRAGGAYVYAYVTTGEMAAFWVGWVQIFEYVFGTASVARGLSTYVDWASNNTMGGWFDEAMPIGGSILAPHFDLLAFFVVITFGLLLAAGVRESTMVNNVLVAINMVTIVFIIIAGATAADTANWSIPAEEVPPEHGSAGGFFPYGALGMIEGAAVCFYGFVGFDSISAAGEEVKNPRRNLPLTIIAVLAVAFLAYASIATVVTMMVPYYLITSVTEVFSQVGLDWAKWVVTVGAIFGISSSMFGALFPLPRLLYSMASDRLFFHFFAHVEWRQSPVLATLVPTVIIAILAGIFDLGQLVMMMCIGTLISYTVVAASVILLRYRSKDVCAKERRKSTIKQIAGFGEKQPSQSTSCLVEAVLMLFLVACMASALVLRYAHTKMVPAIIINILALVLLVVMTLQPKVSPDLPFKTPLVPVIPCLSIFVNVHLMVFMSSDTWIRIAIWILIGIPFYIIFVCCYKRKKNLEENLKLSHATKNGKAPIQIVVESPTPPDTMIRTSNNGGGRSIQTEDKDDEEVVEMQEKITACEIMPYETEDIVVQHAAIIENNEEKEAKIIDMLDKVLQAEEDTYGEVTSLKDLKDETENGAENIVHRKSLSDLSDAGSDASLGNQILSKYDVIVQVHREDLPKVEEEQPDKGEADILEANDGNNDHELVTAFNFNDSETNSRTDESGYSDTLDKTVLNDSIEDVKDEPYIPTPPPFDENFFASPNFKKSYTVPKRPSKSKAYDFEQQEENKPRESVQSNGSQGDGNLAFGSDRQIHFMSKLNNIFQKQIAPPANGEGEEQRKRSNSTGNVVDNKEFSMSRDRPALFLDLKKEIMLREVAQNLRPVNIESKEKPETHVDDDNHEEEEEEEETSMSRTDLKSKLENIFANGGAKLLKPRLMKSNPPTPEEVYPPDTSSSESISKLPKIEKNDTLKRQKDRFGAVLNSLNRLSLNKEDVV